ncbi:hypothetical protein IPG41_06680 [Candidatus Peregrinibacteria bacterium]|nr:MAG: hypothetical protein IPG41_06680 [Candidatus Peregrinibacteria bacterium]
MSLTYQILALNAFLNGLTGIIAMFLVHKQNPKSPINRTLSVFYFFGAIWALGFFFPFTQDSRTLTLFSFQILHVGALFLTVSHLHFICAFLNIYHEKRTLIISGYVFNLLILPFVFTPLFIEDVVPKGQLVYYPDPGILYHIWLTGWTFLIVHSLYLSITHYGKTTGIKKLQLYYIIIADILAFSFGSTSFLLAYNINFPPYLTFISSIHTVILAYIVLRYRFLDFKVTFSNWGKSVVAYFFATLIAIFVLMLGEGLPLGLHVFLISTLYLFSYLRIRSYFDSSHFYKIFQLTNTVHLKNVVNNFIAQNHFYENLGQLQSDLRKIFRNQFQIASVKVVLLSSKTEEYPHLEKHFNKYKGFLVTKEVLFRSETQKHTPPFYEELLSLGELCFPLYKSNRNLIGFLTFGKKPFDEVYTETELQILQGAAHYISLLLSAILYNVHLQSEIKVKTQKLLEQNKEIKKLYELEKETSAVLSHELKTPIVILSNTHWSLVKYLEGHQAQLGPALSSLQKFSKEMKEAIQRMNTMANSIFHLREVEYQLSLDLQKLDWPTQLDQLLHHIENLASKKNLKFSAHFDLKKGTFYAASAQFEQVLTILLDNAVKYTPQGSIKLSVSQKEKTLLAEVTDTGPGIAPQIRKNLFKRFFRGPHGRQVEGLGIGLYMAKKIMDQIGGSISVQENPKKQGVTFRLELPIHTRF